MKKIIFSLLLIFSAGYTLDQETTCLVLKTGEKEFRIVGECMDPIKHFEDFAKRTGREGRPYKTTFDGVWYTFKFD